MTAKEATPAEDQLAEIDSIDPVPEEITLSSGTVVRIERLKARQFFKMLRILTHGGAHVIGQMRLSSDMGEEEFTAQLVGLVLFALPEAGEEAIEFLRSMVIPAGKGAAAEKACAEAMENPELEDMVSLIEAIVRREAADLKALGRRLKALMEVAQKTGQLRENS